MKKKEQIGASNASLLTISSTFNSQDGSFEALFCQSILNVRFADKETPREGRR
jgi:hypothetical protein